MNSVSDNDRFDDLINQIDHTNTDKRNRTIFLSFILSGIFGLILFMSFAQNTNNKEANIVSTNEASNSTIPTTKVPFDKINTPPYNDDIKIEEEVIPVGIKTKIAEEKKNASIGKKGAQFPGGAKGVANYLKANVAYPDDAFNEKIEGEVMVQITIDEAGKVNNPVIIDGLGYGCDEEVIRVLSKMPNWQPATLNGESIKKSYILTVTFSLS